MKRRLIFSVVIACFGLGFCWLFFNRESLMLRRNEGAIRSELLLQSPLGTRLEDVEHMLSKNGVAYKTANFSGFPRRGKDEAMIVIGKKSIRRELGNYRDYFVFNTSVTAFYGFDENGLLIEIWIWKTVDSI